MISEKKLDETRTVSVIKKAIDVDIFVLIHPDGKNFDYIRYYRYYLRKDDNDISLSSILDSKYFDAPYTKFFPVIDSDLWLCVAQNISEKSPYMIDNTVIIFNKNKVLKTFTVKDCDRRSGEWGIKWKENRLLFYKNGKVIEFNPLIQDTSPTLGSWITESQLDGFL